MYTFEVFKDKKKEWRFRLVAPNGEIIAQGEGYKNKKDCLSTVESIQENARHTTIEEVK